MDGRAEEKASIPGVIITSAKKTFFAGGDLDDLIRVRPGGRRRPCSSTSGIKAQLRRLETLGKPVVAAINGAALGGGLEIALACHHRIGLDAPGVEIGLPEVTLGLLPGGGGVTRTVRMLGIADALMKVLGQGQRYGPRRRWRSGLVHELVASREEVLARARAWIDGEPASPQQPWDIPGYKIPGGTPSTPKLAANLPAFPANLRKQLKGAPMPAPRNILAAAVEGTQVDVDTALRIETRYFVELVTGQVAKNMIAGVLLRHAGRSTRGAAAPGRVRRAGADEGRRPRRRDDGRGHRVLVREGGLRRRAQGRLAGGRREGQGVLREAGREGASRRAARPGEGASAARPDHPDRRLRRPRRLRPGHRGRLRGRRR